MLVFLREMENPVNKSRILRVAFAVAGMAALPATAHAESKFVTGTASPLTASASLDFTISRSTR